MFQRTELTLENCREFINNHGAKGTPVEVYLVQHLLIVLCAEIQKCIYDAVADRVAQLPDAGIKSFSVVAAEKILRSVKKTELAGFLGHFGEELQKGFNAEVLEREVTQYNSAVDTRHDIAHPAGKPGKLWTLGDFELALVDAKSVVGKAVRQLRESGVT